MEEIKTNATQNQKHVKLLEFIFYLMGVISFMKKAALKNKLSLYHIDEIGGGIYALQTTL